MPRASSPRRRRALGKQPKARAPGWRPKSSHNDLEPWTPRDGDGSENDAEPSLTQPAAENKDVAAEVVARAVALGLEAAPEMAASMASLAEERFKVSALRQQVSALAFAQHGSDLRSPRVTAVCACVHRWTRSCASSTRSGWGTWVCSACAAQRSRPHASVRIPVPGHRGCVDHAAT